MIVVLNTEMSVWGTTLSYQMDVSEKSFCSFVSKIVPTHHIRVNPRNQVSIGYR